MHDTPYMGCAQKDTVMIYIFYSNNRQLTRTERSTYTHVARATLLANDFVPIDDTKLTFRHMFTGEIAEIYKPD
jgi:hypothetical protein